ncbi:EamA family transporter [candidate division WWE3 bacterium]|nr:EamA family transporter [candidate division WWE3 bacterium]
MTWFIFSLLSITALATAELAQQHLLHSEGHFKERTSTILVFLVQAILILPFILLSGLKDQLFIIFNSLSTLPYIIFVAILGSFSMLFYLKSFRVENISISSIFISLSTVVSTTLGIIFFQEGFYLYKLLGIALILLAIISLNYKNFQLEKNHYYGLIAGLMFGLSYTLDKRVIFDVHPAIYLFWVCLLVALFGFLINSKVVVESIKSARFFHYKPIVLSGVGYLIYNFCTFMAYSVGGEVGRIDAINNSQVFLIILFEYFIYKHKDGVARKFITAGIAFSGVLILGFL